MHAVAFENLLDIYKSLFQVFWFRAAVVQQIFDLF